MPRPGGGNIGHAKHHVAFGRKVAGPRQRVNLQIEISRGERERREIIARQKPPMADSIRILFNGKK
jgi:hypothetical protein